MSTKMLFAALAVNKPITSTQRIVLIYLANHHNQRNNRCDPSEKTLARETGLSVRAVRSSINALLSLGLIDRKQRFNRSNSYDLTYLGL